MVTLATGIGTTERVIDVAGEVPETVLPGLVLSVGGERMVFWGFAPLPVPNQTSGRRNRQRWHVDRSQPEAHDAGVAIERYAPAVVATSTLEDTGPLPAGTGGAGVPDPSGAPDGQAIITQGGALVLGTLQTVTLLGPFVIDFDDAEIGNGIGVADLTAGQLVVAAWAIITVPFVPDDGFGAPAPGPTFIAIAVGSPAENAGIGYYLADSVGPSVADVVTAAVSVAPGLDADNIVSNMPRPAQILDAAQLVAYADGGPFFSGHADIYALIAEPAS